MNRVPRGRDYLVHMLDAVGQIQEYTSGKSYGDFSTNRLLQDAVVRNIEILGEASRKLLEIFRARNCAFRRFRLLPSTRCATSWCTDTLR